LIKFININHVITSLIFKHDLIFQENKFIVKTKMKNFIFIFLFIIIIITVPFASYSQETSDNLFKKGSKLLDEKKYKESIVMFDEALKISPLDPEIYIYRGLAKYYLQEYKDAIIDFTRTIEIQPDYAEAYNLRGIARGDLGDRTGACEDWYKASDFGLNTVIKLIQEFCLDE